MSVRLGAGRHDVLVVIPPHLARSGPNLVAMSLLAVAVAVIVVSVAAIGGGLFDSGAPARRVPGKAAVISLGRPAPAPALIVGVRRADVRAGPERGLDGGDVRAR
jgi:hypothetical protein